MPLFVEFIPPYTNSTKRTEVRYKQEGYMLRDWFRKQGASAQLVIVMEDITVLEPQPEIETEQPE